MAYSDNYPNGYKSGYSSADDPDRYNYSPMGVERERRDAFASSNERDRVMSDYEAGLERERRARERREQERAREEWVRQERERASREKIEKQWEVRDILVKEKRDNYMSKSWFGKAIAKMQGKDYYKNQDKIREDAKRKVENMSQAEIDMFLENQVEKEGRRR